MDPDTGEMLGQDETYIGAIKITDVKSKFSIGTIMEEKFKRCHCVKARQEERKKY